MSFEKRISVLFPYFSLMLAIKAGLVLKG
uniref:Uncharacterized protein n=1 Tax=Rhizophora mucronata TaxID=61149 RepID=A0A2P2N3I5_RHIMU